MSGHEHKLSGKILTLTEQPVQDEPSLDPTLAVQDQYDSLVFFSKQAVLDDSIRRPDI